MHSKQYTIRGVPPALDKALRERSQREHKSLNEVAIEALKTGVGLGAELTVYHDLDFAIGTWKDDPAFWEAIRAQDQIDPDLWR
jgi:hypothetical protein